MVQTQSHNRIFEHFSLVLLVVVLLSLTTPRYLHASDHVPTRQLGETESTNDNHNIHLKVEPLISNDLIIDNLTLDSAEYVYSNTGSKYYKLLLPPLTLATISIYSVAGEGLCLVQFDQLPTLTHFGVLQRLNATTASTVSVNNYDSFQTREIYIMITTLTDYMSFRISTTSQLAYRAVIITGIVFACLFSIFCFAAFVVVVFAIPFKKSTFDRQW